MARSKSTENAKDPATGRTLPQGVSYRGLHQYRARKLVDGTRQIRTFETPKLASEWLRAVEVRAAEGTHVDRRALDKMTLSELVDKYVDVRMRDGGPRRGAADDRASHIPSIKRDDIASMKLSRLTRAAVRGFRDRQSDKHARATTVKRLTLLRSIIGWGIRELDLPMPSNPAAEVDFPEGESVGRDRRLTWPSEESVNAALASGTPLPHSEEDIMMSVMAKSSFPDDIIACRLALSQALRQGELHALHWEDIDFKGQRIMIRGRHGMGSKAGDRTRAATKAKIGWEKRILMPETAAILEAHMGGQKPDPDAKVLSLGSLNAFKVRVGRTIAKAGLADLRWHDLRHESASRIAEDHLPNPLDLKAVTGHRSIATLSIYYHPDPGMLARRRKHQAASQAREDVGCPL